MADYLLGRERLLSDALRAVRLASQRANRADTDRGEQTAQCIGYLQQGQRVLSFCYRRQDRQRLCHRGIGQFYSTYRSSDGSLGG